MRSLTIFLLAFMFICSSGLSYAHPPRDLQLTYDPGTKILKVSISHVTSNIRKHFIRRIEIKVNDKEAQVLNFPAQSSPQEHFLEESLELKAGDRVTVSAICNMGGHRETSLQIQ